MEDPAILCNNCKRDIPAANVDLHLSHCLKYMKLCELCEDPFPIKEFDQHILEEHQEVKCEKCQVPYQQGDEELHQRLCSMADVRCDFCGTDWPRKDISSHRESCGSRTDTCEFCDERVMLKDMETHVCRHSGSDNISATRERDHYSNYTSQSMEHHNILPNHDLYQRLPATNVGADYLDELIATEHLINGSAVDLDAAMAAQLAHDEEKTAEQRNHLVPGLGATSTRPRHQSNDSMLPCEFCQAVFPMEDLILHQSGCLDSSLPGTQFPPDTQFPPPIQFKNDGYIPCEFCCKQFPFSLIDQHQAGCTPTRRGVSTFSEVLDDRPIRGLSVHPGEPFTTPPIRRDTPPRAKESPPRSNVAPTRATARPNPVNKPTLLNKRNIPSYKTSIRNNIPDTTDNDTDEANAISDSRPLKKELVPKPEVAPSGTRGKEPFKFKNIRAGAKNSMNDLDKASSSKSLPAVVVPKRKAYVGRNGKNSSSSDNNVPDSWSSSAPKAASKTGANVMSVNGTKAVNGKVRQTNKEINNFVGKRKETAEEKDVSLNMPSSADNHRTRQNILKKYQKVPVNNSKHTN